MRSCFGVGTGVLPPMRPPGRAGGSPVPGLQIQLDSYAGKVRVLGIFWFAWAALSLAFGVIGLSFANAFMMGHLGPWMNGPWAHGPQPFLWFGPALLHFAWIFLVIRSGLAWRRVGPDGARPVGRVAAIIAAVFSLLRFPLEPPWPYGPRPLARLSKFDALRPVDLNTAFGLQSLKWRRFFIIGAVG